MKKRVGIFLLFYFLCANVLAGEYEGLTPGVSTKADADKVLGVSTRVLLKGQRFDYSPEGHDLKRLSVLLQQDQNTIQSIDLFFKEIYSADQVKEWFDLGGPFREDLDKKGKLRQVFEGKGIVLHFAGRFEKDGVEYLSHAGLSEDGIHILSVTETDLQACPAAAAKYADEADVYIQKDQYAQAIPHLKKAALCDPNKAVYSRMLAFSYYQDGQLNKAIEAAQKTIVRQDDYIAYSVLGTSYWRKKDCRSAIPYLEKAVAFKEDKKRIDNLEFLGVCYYNEGRLNEALTTMVKANKRNRKSPLSVYYLGVISDRLGNQADAKDFYKRYLRLRHKDKDMNFAAKERLSVLKRQSKIKSKRSFSDAFGAVMKDLKDFNSD